MPRKICKTVEQRNIRYALENCNYVREKLLDTQIRYNALGYSLKRDYPAVAKEYVSEIYTIFNRSRNDIEYLVSELERELVAYKKALKYLVFPKPKKSIESDYIRKKRKITI